MIEADQQARAKRYEAIHNVLFLVEICLMVALLLAFLLSGVSRWLADWTRGVAANPWLHVALYSAGVVVAAKLLFLPLGFYGGFHLEHRFGLSNESFGGWLLDETKSLGLSLFFGILVLDVVYFLLRQAGAWWWVGGGVFFLLFGVVLSAVFPVLILPWFYKSLPFVLCGT